MGVLGPIVAGFRPLVFLLGFWNSILFGRPGAQVDHLAAFAAEWTKFIFLNPWDFLSTRRAIHFQGCARG